MTACETLLRIKHDGAFIKLSEQHPSMHIYTWCNKVNEVMEVNVDESEEYGEVLGEVSRLATVVDESNGGGSAHFIVSTCFCTPFNSVEMNIEDLQILNVSPVVLHGGWEHFRMIVFRHEDLSEMIDRLVARGFSLEIMAKSEFKGSLASSFLATEALFSALTGKQVDALMKAQRHGYYRLPRVADVQKIASREGVKRTTFQEHLKRGENKLINALIPYMQLYLTHLDKERHHVLKRVVK